MSQVLGDQKIDVRDDDARQPIELSENAQQVLRARYLIKDEQGRVTETPADLFRRVADAVSRAELLYDPDSKNRSEWKDRFFRLMTSGRFMPNSPTLMNAGRSMGMLSACFVLPVRDSIDEIFDAIKHTAMIQKAGGGTGFAFDELRPTGDYISSSGGSTSGPISFWRAFSEATNAIQQGAFRRGANMGMMYIDHPDILKFLHAKQDLGQFNNYNISVKVTDQWMEAFKTEPDAPHVVRNPRNNKRYYIPKDVEVWEYDIHSLVPADSTVEDASKFHTNRDLWNIIVKHAWQTGEPGVIFIDRINQDNPTPHVGRIEATNPCGEQPLLPYEACNLGSINLAKFVNDPCTPSATVDWDRLRDTIRDATRFLDDVIDINRYPLPEIDAICKANRKIGLGIMGFADALYKLGVPYNAAEGVEWGERFMKFINDEAHDYSEELARRRGSFPNWAGSIWDTRHHRPMRNATCTTVAPTGTISIIAGCSCGIEPMFSLVFYRNVLKGQIKDKKPMVEVNSIFREVITERGLFSEELMDRIAREGTLAHVDDAPEDVRRVFVCAHDISPEWHARMQASFQKHCDSSISKTINFAEEATSDDIDTIYRLAFDLRCKGITVYRNGCRDAQPMALKNDTAKKEETSNEASQTTETKDGSLVPAPMEPATLPEILSSVRVRQMTPFGNMHVQITVNPQTERELEVFAQLGKGGDLANSDLEAICRMVSLWLRAGGRLKHVIQQLKGIGSSLQLSTKDGKIMSLGDGLARALTKYTRAKTHFGIPALLLGDFDLQELDRVQRGLSSLPSKKSSNGNGNGKKNVKNSVQADSTTVATKPQSDVAADLIAERRNLDPEPQSIQQAFKVVCPECHCVLNYTEGCVMCPSCGYSHC